MEPNPSRYENWPCGPAKLWVDRREQKAEQKENSEQVSSTLGSFACLPVLGGGQAKNFRAGNNGRVQEYFVQVAIKPY